MAAISFIAQTGNLSSLTTYSFTSQSLGTPAADRIIAVQITTRKAGTGGLTVDNVTIDGVTATIVQKINAITNTDVVAIAYASVPNDTTGTISVTFSSAPARCTIANYQITGIGTNPTPSDNQNSVAAAPSVSLNIPGGGVALMVALTAAPTTTTWTGLTEDYDAQQSTFETYTGASKAFATTQTGLTITATFVAGGAEPVGLALSFPPLGIAHDNTNSSSFSGVSIGTISHTSTGTSLEMVVQVSAFNVVLAGRQVGTVTYNGVNLTKIRSDEDTAITAQTALWHLTAPATGVHDVVVKMNASSTEFDVGVTTLTGVAQSGQPDANAGGTAAAAGSLSIPLTTVANNCWIVNVTECSAGPGTNDVNTTFNWSAAGSTSLGGLRGPVSPAASYATGFKVAITDNWVGGAASFSPVAPVGTGGIVSWMPLLGVGF